MFTLPFPKKETGADDKRRAPFAKEGFGAPASA
jgi:hypothetical protein